MDSSKLKSSLKEMLSIIVVAFVVSMILRTFILEARVIPSGSMLPTIQIQDRVLVSKFAYWFKEPQRGDIIVFQPPIESDEDYIKRVMGLPGDKLEVRDMHLYINDVLLEEPYIQEPMQYAFGPVTVPEGCLFVMGDNRNSSYDSHLWGEWLSMDAVKGKAFMTYWPLNHIKMLKWEGSWDESTADQ